MKISQRWLNEYVKHGCSVDELSELLTACGLEVEGIEPFQSVKGGLEAVVIGEVKSCEDHPDSDHLHLTTVDIGKEELLPIVCGAANVAAGQKVVVATIGAKIYKGDDFFEIKKSKIRGAVSEGMICAEDELGLGTSHDGIMVLDADAQVGMPASTYFNIENDDVISIGLTPNRSDATSHIGVARDVVAVLNARANDLKHQILYPNVDAFNIDHQQMKINVNVEDADACPRYSCLCIQNVKVGESPKWLKNRLTAVGLRPINNIVDITNFVLMEMGQPLHAFDADKIANNEVIIKKLPKDTSFTTLDGVERKLSGNDLMICDGKSNGLCIAGVMGGQESGVNEATKNIFLESAYFSPVGIRKTARFHGLNTDASFRYERGADPEITIYALKRAAMLIKEIACGEIASEIQDFYPETINKKLVLLSFDYLTKLFGKNIPKDQVINILKSLEIEIIRETPEELDLLIPTNKNEVTRPADVAEEILRIYGYNNIDGNGLLTSSFSYTNKPDSEKIYQRIANLLTSNGFAEIMCNSQSKADILNHVPGFEQEKSVYILNALSNELNVMRQSLLFGGLESIAFNRNRKNFDLKFYEFGNIYQKRPEVDASEKVSKRYLEEQHLALFMSGNKSPETWETPSTPANFFTLKNKVNMILESLRLTNYEIDDELPAYFSSGIRYLLNNKPILLLGKIDQKVLKYFDIKQDVFYADFNWNLVKKYVPSATIVYQEISKFPEVRRDLALLLDKEVSFAQIKKIAFQSEKKLLQAVNLFDVYEGDKLAEGKKSYAVSFILQDATKTLTDKQIDKVMEKLTTEFKNQLGASLR